jgi:hypothetical protein
MPSKQLEAGLSSDIYDAAVAGMKKATRLNHNAAATRKPSCPQSFDGPASLGTLFQNENKSLSNESILLQSRSTKNGLSPSNKQRSIAREDEKQANIDIVWPSVRVTSNYLIEAFVFSSSFDSHIHSIFLILFACGRALSILCPL